MDNKTYTVVKKEKKKFRWIRFVLRVKTYFELLSREYEEKCDKDYVYGLNRYKGMYTKL